MNLASPSLKRYIAHQSVKFNDIPSILDHALYIGGKWGFIFRGYSGKIGSLFNPILFNTRKYTSIKYFVLLNHLREHNVIDNKLYDLIENDPMSAKELSKNMGISNQKMNSLLRKEEALGNIIRYQNIYFTWEQFETKFPELISSFHTIANSLLDEPTQLKKHLILSILERYPFLSIKQLSYLSMINRIDLTTVLSQLIKENYVKSKFYNSFDETFYTEYISLNSEAVNDITVLERYDPLVRLLEINGLVTQGYKYWLFNNGSPLAEFSLRTNKNKKILSKLNILTTTSLQSDNIISKIIEWSKQYKVGIGEKDIHTPQSHNALKFIKILLKRGYKYINNGLEWQNKPQSLTEDFLKQNNISYWYKTKQINAKYSTTSQLLDDLIQLESKYSIAIRLHTSPQLLNFDNVIYTSGIFHRFGYISIKHVPLIISAWPKNPKLYYIDKKIISIIGDDVVNVETIINSLKETRARILQRISYLENVRAILRDQYNVNSYKKFPFTTNPDAWSSLHALSRIVVKFLEFQIPMTKEQIIRYFGISDYTFTELRNYLLSRDEIIEGFFLPNYNQIQFSTPEVIAEIKNHSLVEDESMYSRVDILPYSDPMITLHLNSLLAKNVYLQPKKRPVPGTEIWGILLDGSPIGYVKTYPSISNMVDVDIEINVVNHSLKIPILSGILQKIAMIFKIWNNDTIKLISINNEDPRISKWSQLHFVTESLDILY